jgi:hypothetical protein
MSKIKEKSVKSVSNQGYAPSSPDTAKAVTTNKTVTPNKAVLRTRVLPSLGSYG